MNENEQSEKDGYILLIMSLFQDNVLLNQPILKNILKQFSDDYLIQLYSVLLVLDLSKLGEADNNLYEALNKFPQDKVDIENLKNHLMVLQLNVLLSQCFDDNRKILLKLIEAINDKFTSLNNLIDTRKKPETSEFIINSNDFIQDISCNELNLDCEKNNSYNIIEDDSDKEEELKQLVMKQFKCGKVFYPTLINKSHNDLVKLINKIQKKKVDTYDFSDLTQLLPKLMFYTIPQISLKQYYDWISISKYRPTDRVDLTQSINLYKIYGVLTKNQPLDLEQKKEIVRYLINYVASEILHQSARQSSHPLMICNKFKQINEEHVARTRINLDLVNSLQNKLLELTRLLEKQKKQKGGAPKSVYYYKYIKYKHKYLSLKQK
mgnify:CR=1 FL=1